MKYSTVILAKNEQAHIKAVIENVGPLSNEILVVDDFSRDNTAQIAEDLGAKVVQRALNDDWSAQRNFAMELVQSDWTLVADADERLDPELACSFSTFTPNAIVRALSVNRLNYFKSHPLNHPPYSPDIQIRGIRSDVRYDPTRPVHERPLVQPNEIIEIDGMLHHFTYEDACEAFIKFERYGNLERQSGQEKDKIYSVNKSLRLIGRRAIKEGAIKDGWPGVATVLAEAYGDFCAALKTTAEH